MPNINKGKFYVYLIRDPRPDKNNAPIYVGKGKGYRANKHLTKSHNPTLRAISHKCRKLNLKLLIEIVRRFDCEDDAFRFEIELIAQYGRRELCTGSLCNMTNGGEGTSGSLITSENMRRLHADPIFAERQRKGAVAHLRRLQADPVYAQGRDERLRLLNADPAFKEKNREATRLHHADPAFIKAAKERLLKLHADPAFKEANRKRAREQHTDPAFVKAQREGMLRLNADPAFKKTIRENMRRLNADPAFKEAVRERARKRNTDPAFIAKVAVGLRRYYSERRVSKHQLTFDFEEKLL